MNYARSLGIIAILALPKITFAAQLINPLGATTNPNVIIGNIIQGLLGVIGTIALLLFIYGGLLMMLSAGSTERVKKGRDTMVWAAIGIGVIFASYALTEYVLRVALATPEAS
jgi:hypothetical protein